MSWIAVATAVATVASAGLQYLGTKEQTEAIDRAAESTENWQKYLVALEERKYEEAARFRDLAFEEATLKVGALRETLPQLQEAIGKAPESAREFYALAGRRGTEDIMRNLAPFGLSPESSTAGRAVGLLQEGLSATEARDLVSQEQFRTNTMLNLIGRTSTGVSPETGSATDFSGASAAQQNLSDLYTTRGAVTGGLYGSYAQTLSQLPAMYNLLKGGAGGTGQPVGGTTGNAAQFSFPGGTPPELRNVI